MWSGMKISATGYLIIRVRRGRVPYEGAGITLYDPFDIPILSREIPPLEQNEYWDLSFTLTHFLHHGRYRVEVLRENRGLFELEFFLESRKRAAQQFLFEGKIKFSGLKRSIESVKFTIPSIPDTFFLQSREWLDDQNNNQITQVFLDQLRTRTQKTYKWQCIIQPSFLPLDTLAVGSIPDEYYGFNILKFTDEPGLELSMIDIEEYQGSHDLVYPIQVIQDVLTHVHRNMRYVRQTKERGLEYALQNGRGDCTEYAAFFVSLLRRLGLNSRLVSGMSRSYHNNWISHAFAEVYIYGSWIPVDVVRPPKPYLQLGNRGELLGLNRQNWLDPEQQEFKFQFMGVAGTSPRISFEQKVTESGISKLPKSQQVRPRRDFLNRLKQRLEPKVNIKVTPSRIHVNSLAATVNSIALVQGALNFGKIVYMQYVDQAASVITMADNYQAPLHLVTLDKEGNLEEAYQIL